MTRLEFSDFYKFLVSLGSVLVALALILPWLFLRESFDALVSVSDISKLTLAGQALIRHRQTSALWFIQNTIWISGVVAMTGIALLGLGVVLWWRRQKVVDERERLETKKARLEVESLTAAQIAEETMKEADEQVRLEEGEEAREETQVRGAGEAEVRARYRSRVEEYFGIENSVLDKLLTCFGGERVLTHKRIRGTVYDAVVLPPYKAPDAIFEIKVTRSEYLQKTFRRSLEHLILATQNYAAATGRRARGILLVVLLEGVPGGVQVDEYNEAAQERAKTHEVELGICLIAEEDLVELACKDLNSVIRGAAGGLKEC